MVHITCNMGSWDLLDVHALSPIIICMHSFQPDLLSTKSTSLFEPLLIWVTLSKACAQSGGMEHMEGIRPPAGLE